MAEKKIDFIDGTFDVTDAAEILLSVINDKIRFHNVQIISKNIRSDEEQKNSLERLERLTKTKEEIMSMFRTDCDADTKLKIKSTIQIEIVD